MSTKQNDVYYCVSHKSKQIKFADRLQFTQRINDAKNGFVGTKFTFTEMTAFSLELPFGIQII